MIWLRRELLRLADVRPDEGGAVGLLLVHSLFLGVPRVLTASAAMALFLEHSDASRLPLVYLAAALAVPVTGFVRLRLSARLPFRTLLLTDLALVLTSLLLLRAGLSLESLVIPIALVLPVWVEVEWVLLNLEFWGLAGQRLNVRQGKRLFGLIGAGELVSASLIGLAVPQIVARVGTPNLLLLSALATAACFGLVLRLQPGSELRKGDAGETRTVAGEGLAELSKDRYLKLICALVALSYLAYYFIDNVFYSFAERRYPDADVLAGYLGIFWSAVALATLLLRTVVSGRLLLRFGILGGLLALPLVLGLGAGLVTLSGAAGGAAAVVFGTLAVTKLLDQALRDSVDKSALLLLYQPLPGARRVRAQTTVEGIVGPAAGGLAGLLLLLLASLGTLEPTQLASLTLAVVVGWLAVALSLEGEYAGALRQALASRRLGGASLAPRDASALGLLEAGLRSPHPGEALYCLEVLEEMRLPGFERAVLKALDHPRPEVRHEALACVERQELLAVLGPVRERIFSDDDPEVRGAALRALAAIGEPGDLDRLHGMLDAREEPVRRGALVGLLRHGGIEGVLGAGEQLVSASRNPDPSERRFAARSIGEVGVAGFYRPLLPLLRDADPATRRSAVQASARLRHPRLWPLVLENLDDPRTRSVAVSALQAGGEDVVPLLEASFDAAAARNDRPVVRRIARLLGQLPGERAGEFLWARAGHAATDVRLSLLSALVARGFRASPGQRPVAEQRIAEEVDAATGWLAAREDMREEPGVALLLNGLSQALDQARARVLCLLAYLLAPDAVQRVRVSLLDASADRRAQAVELVDSLVSRSVSALVVPLIEDLPQAERLARLRARFSNAGLAPGERLRRLAEEKGDSWLRCCALHAAGEARRTQIVASVRDCAGDADPLVRETAAWALARLEPRPAAWRASEEVEALIERFERQLGARGGGRPMLSTMEKVVILKGVSIFAETPDEVLAEVASLLEEVEVAAGQAIFSKGDVGSAMYVVVEGNVRVHDGERTLRELGPRDIFGEMAALDPEPRSASVTALGPTQLFRLDQDALYELMGDRIEVVRGVIRVLCHRLRAWTN